MDPKFRDLKKESPDSVVCLNVLEHIEDDLGTLKAFASILPIGGKAVLEDIEPRHWERFAADAGLGAPFVRTRVGQLCNAVITAIDGEFAKALPSNADFSAVKAVVRERAVTLKNKA